MKTNFTTDSASPARLAPIRDWERIWAPLAVFLLAFAGRGLLASFFFSRFGSRASQAIEIWYYYGVARGVFSLSILDPTFILLRALGLIVPAARLYDAVAVQAMALSALTAVAIYAWISRWSGRSAGFWAGAVYALLPAPIVRSSANYTHDLVQLPVIVLLAWALTPLLKGERRTGRVIPALVLSALLLAAGTVIGPMIEIFILALLLHLLWKAFRRLPSRILWLSPPALFMIFLVIISFGLYLVARGYLLSWLAPLAQRSRGIDLRAQLAMGMADLQPLQHFGLWRYYNLFLFLIPPGLAALCRRRDFFPVSLLLVSLALALAVVRATRLLDIAVAVVVATALTGSEEKDWALALRFWAALIFLHAVLPSGAAALRLAIPQGGLKDLFVALGGQFSQSPFLQAWLSGPGLTVLAFVLFLPWLAWLKWRKAYLGAILIGLTALLQWRWVWESISPASIDLEWQAYRWLDERASPGEKILAHWNQGFLIQAVTALEPIATPDRTNLELPRLFWMEEEEAWEELRRREVKYVHVNTRVFGVYGIDEAQDSFWMTRSTIGPPPAHITRFSELRQTLLYRLLYEPQALKRFRPIFDRDDLEHKIGVRIYALVEGG